jgi:hypothetical protein
MMFRSSTRQHYHTSLSLFKNKKRTRDDGSNQELSWKKFEFSQMPKHDKRFGNETTAQNSANSDLSNEEMIRQLEQHETVQDALYQKEQREKLTAWEQLDADLVRRATEAIRPIVNNDRIQRIESVLQQRTAHTRFLFESALIKCMIGPIRLVRAALTLTVFFLFSVSMSTNRPVQSEQRLGLSAHNRVIWDSARRRDHTV